MLKHHESFQGASESEYAPEDQIPEDQILEKLSSPRSLVHSRC